LTGGVRGRGNPGRSVRVRGLPPGRLAAPPPPGAGIRLRSGGRWCGPG